MEFTVSAIYGSKGIFLNLNLNLNLNLVPQILHFPGNQTENGKLLRLPGPLSPGGRAEDAGFPADSGGEGRNSAVSDARELSE